MSKLNGTAAPPRPLVEVLQDLEHDSPALMTDTPSQQAKQHLEAQTSEKYYLYRVEKLAEVTAPDAVAAVANFFHVGEGQVIRYKMPGYQGRQRDERLCLFGVEGEADYSTKTGDGELIVVSHYPYHLVA